MSDPPSDSDDYQNDVAITKQRKIVSQSLSSSDSPSDSYDEDYDIDHNQSYVDTNKLKTYLMQNEHKTEHLSENDKFLMKFGTLHNLKCCLDLIPPVSNVCYYFFNFS